jgi:hypothetical protein
VTRSWNAATPRGLTTAGTRPAEIKPARNKEQTMDFITGAISDVLDKAERDATAKFDELTGVTHQQGAEIAKQLCLIRAELAGIRMAIVDAAAAGRSK